jgi:hypothetical protein
LTELISKAPKPQAYLWRNLRCGPLEHKFIAEVMANSKFEYVKAFEQPDSLLPNTWVVVRIDGRAFTKYVPFTVLEMISYSWLFCRPPWRF